MAQKTNDPDDQPNPSSSSAKEYSDRSTTQRALSHTTGSTPAPHHPKYTDFKGTEENASSAPTVTKTAAAGPSSSSKEAMTGPSPYGTRSRNRGQVRPNYAEDKDVDVEMEDAFSEKKDADQKKPSRQTYMNTNGAGDAPRAPTSTLRKSTVADEARTSSSTNPMTKDSHPTTSTSSTATPAPSTTSKKRKASTQLTTSNGHSSANTSAPAATTTMGTRRSTIQTTAHNTTGYKETNMLDFGKGGAFPKDGKLVAEDGTVLEANDHVYLVCEPPGEPYYLGRIMEFLHVQNDSRKVVDALRINWYYRPKDIGKKVNDTRVVFATMHSDISPLTALRGKCQIRHKAEVQDFEKYRKTPDCFWFEKLYDRYIQKHYDVIPCFQIVNVPEKVKKVLDERWKYILVEQGRAKEFTSAVKLCKKCGMYCANHESVDCAVCQQTYHMNCVRPPLLKKPSRGFAWACAACSRAQEKKLEARHTPNFSTTNPDAEEEENWEEEDEAVDTNRTSPSDGIDDTHEPATPEQIYHASLWPYRYLGQHCKPEDALDYDDRIYPRAGSRQGPKHQATVLSWPGRPVKLVKPLEVKKIGKKDSKLAKEALAAIDAERIAREKRPKWIQDEPPGYVARGEDLDSDDPNNTAQLLWKPTDDVGAAISSAEIDDFVSNAKTKLIPALGILKESTNFLDIARNTLFEANFETDKAFRTLSKADKTIFKEPELSPAEIKKFEEAVAKHGSELYQVTKQVKTVKHARIVRFYYTWKKTDKGKQIWGNFSGRKGKKEAKKAEATANRLQDDVADDQDDSAFDTDKAMERKRGFICKFCHSKSSRQWRRAPNVSPALYTEGGGKGANKDKGVQYIIALCRRCAELWRRYAIQWEDAEDLAKKVAVAGSRSWKRRVDEELLKELMAANEMMNLTLYNTADPLPPKQASPAASVSQSTPADAPPRKKLKAVSEKDVESTSADVNGTPVYAAQKKKEKVTENPPAPPPPPPPPPAPEFPKPRILPCAICKQMSPQAEQSHLCCKECRLTVHRACYGVMDNRHPGKWTCDMCLNDKNPQVSIEYKCVLCPVEFTEHDFVEPPKISHKKKSEKEREKDRLDRELAQKAAEHYRKLQEDNNRPVNPREPLKRTADNNWVHVTCAVWTPEVKFGNAKALGPSEGIPSIPRARYDEVCKACKQKGGACVTCHQCRIPVHVECAHKSGYLLGFEITPVKGSRRDQHNIVTIGGETGAMSAAIWCKEHIPQKTLVHRMYDPVVQPDGEQKEPNALQLYVRQFKQADLTLTGTVRKANLANLATKSATSMVPASQNRRQSTTAISSSTSASQKGFNSENAVEAESVVSLIGDKVCMTCGVDVSPKWWRIDKSQEKILINGYGGSLGSEAQRFLTQRSFQCHKCKKANRQPIARASSPSASAPLPVEPPRAPPVLTAGLTSPPPVVSHATNRLSDFGSSWGSLPTMVPAATVSTAVPPLSAPSGGPPPLPLTAPAHAGLSPIAAPGPPQAITHPYPPPGGSFGDWQHNTTQSTSASHQTNATSPPLSMHHNHLRDLRPPPLAPVTHHQTGPVQHGLGQPMANGVPPSPPRRGPATLHNGTPSYMASYQHSTQSPLHALTNGGPPPRASENSFSQGLLTQRPPFSTPHGSPPVSREGIAMSREPSLGNSSAPRRDDGRPTSGASASPSLRNLLS